MPFRVAVVQTDGAGSPSEDDLARRAQHVDGADLERRVAVVDDSQLEVMRELLIEVDPHGRGRVLLGASQIARSE